MNLDLSPGTQWREQIAADESARRVVYYESQKGRGAA